MVKKVDYFERPWNGSILSNPDHWSRCPSSTTWQILKRRSDGSPRSLSSTSSWMFHEIWKLKSTSNRDILPGMPQGMLLFFFVTHNSDIVHTRVVDLRVSILKSEQRFGRSWMWSTQVLPLNTQLSESRLWWTPADSHLLWLCPSQTCAGVVFSWRRCVGALSVWCLFRTSEMVEETAFYELSQNM